MRKYSLPKRILRNDDLLTIRTTGIWYGFPTCCIEWFKENFLDLYFDKDSEEDFVLLGSGLVVCPACRERQEQEILTEIQTQRICPRPFPDGACDNTISGKWALALLNRKVTDPRVTEEDLDDLASNQYDNVETHLYFKEARAERQAFLQSLSARELLWLRRNRRQIQALTRYDENNAFNFPVGAGPAKYVEFLREVKDAEDSGVRFVGRFTAKAGPRRRQVARVLARTNAVSLDTVR